MNIAVYAPFLSNSDLTEDANFTVSTCFLLLSNQNHKFFIITEVSIQHAFPSAIKPVMVKPPSNNALLKRIWWDVKLPTTLKKTKADLLIIFDHNCSSTLSIPQLIVIQNTEEIKASRAKKARLLVVISESAKKQLMQMHKIPAEKIAIVNVSAAKHYKPINTEQKEDIKQRYSEGKEFFICSTKAMREEKFVNLLKSFSHFKKRQQSSFRLLLITQNDSFLEKKLAGYKYRDDIKFIRLKDKKDQPLLIAAAYAVIVPFPSGEDIFTALNAMQSGVPVIASQGSDIKEVAADAAVYAEEGSIKDIGERMMQLYIDENYRSGLIAKGKARAALFTREKAADSLWQSIMKVL